MRYTCIIVLLVLVSGIVADQYKGNKVPRGTEISENANDVENKLPREEIEKQKGIRDSGTGILIDGNARVEFSERFKSRLAKGQKPPAIVVYTIDSREMLKVITVDRDGFSVVSDNNDELDAKFEWKAINLSVIDQTNNKVKTSNQ